MPPGGLGVSQLVQYLHAHRSPEHYNVPGPTAFASSWSPETQASHEPYRNRSHADFTCWNVERKPTKHSAKPWAKARLQSRPSVSHAKLDAVGTRFAIVPTRTDKELQGSRRERPSRAAEWPGTLTEMTDAIDVSDCYQRRRWNVMDGSDLGRRGFDMSRA